MKKIAAFFFIILLFGAMSAPIYTHQKLKVQTRFSADGLRYIFIEARGKYGPIRIHAVEADLTKYKIALALARDKIGETNKLSEIAEKKKAIAAINGTFFNLNQPSLPISNLFSEQGVIFLSELKRTHCVIKKDKIFFDRPEKNPKILLTTQSDENFYAWGINRPRKKDEVVIYTFIYGKNTLTSDGIEFVVEGSGEITEIIFGGNAEIPSSGYIISLGGQSKKIAKWLSLGMHIRIEVLMQEDWRDADYIFAGGPRLLEKGQIVSGQSAKEEKFSRYLLVPHPRSALALTKDGKILLAAIDGRQRQSVGATYWELAHILRDLGAIEAMGLDGGYSSALWLNGKIINSPADGERRIPNAVVLLKK